MTTWCTECDNVCHDTRKERPWHWRCLAVPTQPGYGYVDPTYSPSPPYQLCRFINTEGACEMFVPVRQPATTGA